MIHLTLNTGHAVEAPRSEVGDEAIAVMTPLLRQKQSPLPWVGDGYTVYFTPGAGGAVFSVQGPKAAGEPPEAPRPPLITCGLAWAAEDADAIWGPLEEQYFRLTESAPQTLAMGDAAPDQPQTLPWLAVLILPGIAVCPEACEWLGDFERCFAWTILENRS